MTEQPVRLDDLISHINDNQPDGDPLARLSDAVLTSRRLGDLADQLIGHFVDQARRSGAAWSAIGEAMGVTKQAAQQRFVASPAALGARDLPLNRFTPRARSASLAARSEALAMSKDQVGTGHLLLGLLSEPEGLAARAIAALGATPDQVRDRLGAGPPPEYAAFPQQIPFTPPARKALAQSLRAAIDLEHNYIGTEHLLLGIMAEGKDVGARALQSLGITEKRVLDWVRSTIEMMAAARSSGR
jgi:ClpA/ClpB-like protein